MAAPRYIERFARLPRVFELLVGRPDGLPLSELAAAVGTSVDELREDLLLFYATEPKNMLFGLQRPDAIDFCAADGTDADPSVAEVVRIIGEQPWDELGVEHLDASELALIYTAAQALLEIEPDNADLAGAVDVLTQTMLDDPAAGASDAGASSGDAAGVRRSWNQALDPLRTAIEERRKVRLTYSPAWSEGVSDRVVEPWRLVQTRRGWEVDGRAGEDLRTYLLAHIRAVEVLEETFEVPADADARIEAQRATTTVRVRVPHSARWAADFYAERVTVVADDELSATLDLALLPPVDRRIGLLLLVAGEEASVLSPSGLVAAGPRLAAELLEHHRS
jgi:predicted DNA-binding transcriptional regulator YafY